MCAVTIPEKRGKPSGYHCYENPSHLYKVAQVAPSGSEIEMTDEGEPVFPGASYLQLVSPPDVPKVRPITRCNRQTMS